VKLLATVFLSVAMLFFGYGACLGFNVRRNPQERHAARWNARDDRILSACTAGAFICALGVMWLWGLLPS
jgi:hypothetical protein